MVSPGVPVPVMVGVSSVVMLSPTVPESLLAASAAAGAEGAAVSMVMESGVAGLTTPVGLVAVTLRLLMPSAKGSTGVTCQVPSAATVVVAMICPAAFLMVMVSPAIPVPSSTGRLMLVTWSVLLLPLSLLCAMRAAGADLLGLSVGLESPPPAAPARPARPAAPASHQGLNQTTFSTNVMGVISATRVLRAGRAPSSITYALRSPLGKRPIRLSFGNSTMASS